jgi:hypothetical protein
LLTREQMVDAVEKYFIHMDEHHAEEITDLFAPDGVLMCESNGMRVEGHRDIKRFFQRLSAGTDGMLHTCTNWVVDLDDRKVSCELSYTNEKKATGHYESENCNFFDFDENGKFIRVRYWAGNPTQWVPLD